MGRDDEENEGSDRRVRMKHTKTSGCCSSTMAFTSSIPVIELALVLNIPNRLFISFTCSSLVLVRALFVHQDQENEELVYFSCPVAVDWGGVKLHSSLVIDIDCTQ